MSTGSFRKIKCRRAVGKTSFLPLIIYCISVIIGYIYISRFTIPVHIRTDEELYLSMARSFHAGQGFVQYGHTLNYSSVLYSVIISVAYFFYSPEYILLIIRGINVLIMFSAVFPVYKLCGVIIGDKKLSTLITVICALLPEMAMTGYIMQEILYYPLLLWGFYFMYLDIGSEQISYNTVLVTVFYMLAFWTKTVGFVFPLIYAGWIMLSAILKKNRKYITKALVNVLICLTMLGLQYLFIYTVNTGEGTNHYATQASYLFPITAVTVRCLVVGALVYIACTLVSMGVAPIAVPLKIKYHVDDRDREYVYIMLTFLIVTIIEIIMLVVYTENRDFIVPKKFLYRYMFPMFVPFFVLMIKTIKASDDEVRNTGFRKEIAIFAARILMLSAIILVVYYCIIRAKGMSGLVDGLLFTMITNLNNHVWQYSGVAFSLGLLAISIIIQIIINNYSMGNLTVGKCVILLYLLIFASFDIVSFMWFPYYSNIYCRGLETEPQIIKLANEINAGKHDRLIHVCRATYVQDSIWGYINEDYELCQMSEYDAMIEEQMQDNMDKISYIIIDKDIVYDLQEYEMDIITETSDYILASIGGKDE